ncbi:PREDICTED: histidine-rich glycoprotein-like [Dipodomys ordii]|uniref:Histidine-rich glycoprotein-like n=1 Tax=Dipodomys ordii TaxID=10020 RepID=A0A1S3GAF4_DIPOR|nr:PREDICTED: histidine-rich glycoprotein-like [Dipodomys ordii]
MAEEATSVATLPRGQARATLHLQPQPATKGVHAALLGQKEAAEHQPGQEGPDLHVVTGSFSQPQILKHLTHSHPAHSTHSYPAHNTHSHPAHSTHSYPAHSTHSHPAHSTHSHPAHSTHNHPTHSSTALAHCTLPPRKPPGAGVTQASGECPHGASRVDTGPASPLPVKQPPPDLKSVKGTPRGPARDQLAEGQGLRSPAAAPVSSRCGADRGRTHANTGKEV